MDIGLKLNQEYLVGRIGLVVQRPRKVPCDIWPKRSILLQGKDLGKFPVSLFTKPLPKTKLLHSGKGPDLHVAISTDNDSFDVGIDPQRIGSEHVPRLKQPTPSHVGHEKFFDTRECFQGHGHTCDGNQVEQDENADRTPAKGIDFEILLFWSGCWPALTLGLPRSAFLPPVSFRLVHRPSSVGIA